MRAHLIAGVVALVLGAGVVPAAAQSSADAELKFNAGLTHLREGRPDMAIEEFKAAIKQDPKSPYFRKGLGQALAAQGKYREAIESFRKALELNPYYVDVRNDLGAALILSGGKREREEGKKEFLTAYNEPTNPTPEVSSRNLGQAYFEERSYNQAYDWFRASLQRNKSYPDAHLGLADTMVAMGRLDEAITQLEAALPATSEHPAVLVALGEAYYRAGRFTEARARLEQAMKADPLSPSGRRAAELLKKFPK